MAFVSNCFINEADGFIAHAQMNSFVTPAIDVVLP